MTQRDDQWSERPEPAPTVDPSSRDAPGGTGNAPSMDDVDRDARDTKPLRAPQPADQEDPPLQSEDGDMFLHAEDDMDF